MAMTRDSKNQVWNDHSELAAEWPIAFSFDNHNVRTILREDGVWFVAKDVCDVLEHSNSSAAVGRLQDDERGVSTIATTGGPQQMAVINESGLYELVLTSRKPQARAFRRWITREVLPSMRRIARGDPIADKPGQVTLSLEAPGRYTVTLIPGEPAEIQSMPLHIVSPGVRAVDLEILCLALRSIGSWWRRNETVRSMGAAVDHFDQDQLLLAVLNGDQLADHYLKTVRAAVN
jgi:BRO family, N-terminal domain